jgi:putative ABC transport system permease protein
MRDILLLSWQAIWRHKLRGLLAVAGVAVGITAITGIISAETSWARALDQTFAQLGVTKVAVDPPAADAEAMRGDLTLDDVDAIRDTCTLAKSVIPISSARLEVKVGREVWTAVVKAGGLGVEDAHGIELTAGRRLEEADLSSKAPVCLVATFIAEKLFGSAEHIGRVLRIGGRGFTVAGTFHDRSGDHSYRRAMVGERAEVYLPITTAQRIPQLNGVHKIIVEAEDQVGAANQINALLRHRLRAASDAEFTTSAATMKQAALRSRRRVSLFVALAAFLALLVAAIGVANVLLVSVAERAREIGLRRAFGATSWAVAWQFLAESLTICLAGAVAGGVAAILLVRGFFAGRTLYRLVCCAGRRGDCHHHRPPGRPGARLGGSQSATGPSDPHQPRPAASNPQHPDGLPGRAGPQRGALAGLFVRREGAHGAGSAAGR